jgi:hypothetical protein
MIAGHNALNALDTANWLHQATLNVQDEFQNPVDLSYGRFRNLRKEALSRANAGSAAIVCVGTPMSFVQPALWKPFYGYSRDKEGGRQGALQLFPGAYALLARKMDHRRADAALIALHGAQRHITVRGSTHSSAGHAESTP